MLYLEVMRTLITVIVILKMRLGGDEEHREWDAWEELRYRLKDAAKEVLGKNYGMESVTDERNFFYTLLCDDAVIEALRKEEKDSYFGFVFYCFGQNEEKGELAALIMQKKKNFF